MQLEAETPRCSGGTCQVCQLFLRLIEGGAENVAWSDLNEHSCHLYFRLKDDRRCVYGLRLDIDRAGYRRPSKGEQTKMCDFAMIAAIEDTASLVVVELKSGVAYAEDVEQLSEGLRVLHDHFEEDGLNPQMDAYWVVGKEVDKLRFAMRDRLTSLRFGPKPVQLQILECGATVYLQEA